MTAGEAAKKMDVTVRTLQHYDKEGLLSPSAVSDGGRRLYMESDFTWNNLWPLLVIFLAAVLLCAISLKKLKRDNS